MVGIILRNVITARSWIFEKQITLLSIMQRDFDNLFIQYLAQYSWPLVRLCYHYTEVFRSPSLVWFANKKENCKGSKISENVLVTLGWRANLWYDLMFRFSWLSSLYLKNDRQRASPNSVYRQDGSQSCAPAHVLHFIIQRGERSQSKLLTHFFGCSLALQFEFKMRAATFCIRVKSNRHVYRLAHTRQFS